MKTLITCGKSWLIKNEKRKMQMNRFDFLIFFGLFFLAFGIVFFDQSKVAAAGRSVLAASVAPFQISTGRLRNFYAFWTDAFFNIRELKLKNQELIRKNFELESSQVLLSDLKSENETLKKQLNFAGENRKNLLGANIVSRDYQNSRSFIIDAGASSGLSAGMTVLAGGGNIVGQIISANERTSQVRTIFDTATKISSITQISRAAGLARGMGSNLILDLVPKSNDLSINETIISSGQDGIWPKGLVVGKIAAVDSDQNQIFKIAHLESLIDWSKLDQVFVIIQ